MADFKLSAQLAGHDSDVKAVSFPAQDTVLSASRDGSVRIWRRTATSPPAFEASISSQTSEFVNSVSYIRPLPSYPEGLIISGGKDTIVEVKRPGAATSDNAERLLIGHSLNVCTLDVSPKATYIVSGGWDGQALVWSTGKWETEVRLGGHDALPVWAVLALDETTVVTGSADTNIRIYDLRSSIAGEAQPKSTISTSEVIRALCRVPKGHPSGADIASASNDGIIRLWKLNGQLVGELHGHENFIYALASLPTGELVSSGEDRSVRIWKGEECVQTITHPAISVWTVAVCEETGDIVSGASDGVARVFTRSSERLADPETITQFLDSVKASAIPQQQLPDINKEKLPGPGFLKSKSGTKDGQIQMINEGNGQITAHQWSASQQQWNSIGTVVDSAGSSGRKVDYKGKSYDYVFDVDIEDGKPPLKLPYDLSSNPYDAATKFLGDNELPISYLENVANFIVQNTQGATLGQSAPSEPSYREPWGSEARYRPGDASAPPPKPKILPQRDYLSITAAKYEAIANKILSLNANMISSGRKDAALNPTEQKILQSLRESLEKSKPFDQQGLDLVIKIITKWAYSERLPGLDLLRCMAPSSLVAEFSSPQLGSIIQTTIYGATESLDGQLPNENCVMMALRTIANLFASANGRGIAAKEAETVVSFLERVVGVTGGEGIGKFNRNVLIAATTTLINYAIMGGREKGNPVAPGVPKRLLLVLGKILTEQSDSEVVYRGLVAVGTFSTSHKAEAVSLGVESWVKSATGRVSEARVQDVGKECLQQIR